FIRRAPRMADKTSWTKPLSARRRTMGILVVSRARRKVVQGSDRARDGSTERRAGRRPARRGVMVRGPGRTWRADGRGATVARSRRGPDGTVAIGGRAEVMRC